MISMLFDTSWFYDLLVVVFIAFIIWLVLKYKQARAPIIFCLMLILIGFTAYAGIELNYYYTAEGGIFGKITGVFQTNVAVVSEQTFSFYNMELTQENGNTYSLKITSDEVFTLEDDQQFMVYVNNEPCYYVDNSNSNQYVIAKYSYIFLDEELNELCTDTLIFNFAFYTNSTYLSVKTEGGAEAVKHWNYYFNKNFFDVRIEKTDYTFDNEITFGDGDISNYFIATYYVESEIYSIQFYHVGEEIDLIIGPRKEGYVFCNWVDENNNIIEDKTIFTSDVSFYAVYEEGQYLDDFVFKGHALISYIGSDEHIVIPESYSIASDGSFIEGEDFIVEEVEYMTFYNIKEIKTITLPKTIKILGTDFMFGLDLSLIHI